MGQAKQRGTFEQRMAEAIERKQREEALEMERRRQITGLMALRNKIANMPVSEIAEISIEDLNDK